MSPERIAHVYNLRTTSQPRITPLHLLTGYHLNLHFHITIIRALESCHISISLLTVSTIIKALWPATDMIYTILHRNDA